MLRIFLTGSEGLESGELIAQCCVQGGKVIRTFPPGGRLLYLCLHSEHLLLNLWQNERVRVLILCVLHCSSATGPALLFPPCLKCQASNWQV